MACDGVLEQLFRHDGLHEGRESVHVAVLFNENDKASKGRYGRNGPVAYRTDDFADHFVCGNRYSDASRFVCLSVYTKILCERYNDRFFDRLWRKK